MAESRQTMKNTYGNMITYHDEYNGGDQQRMRATNTFKSNISFGDPRQGVGEAKITGVRQRQFEANPVQPGATRQSYQGSDIFGTQGQQAETVQKSAYAQKDLRQRESRTFARSDVMGNDQAADKMGEGGLHHAVTTRNEQKWQSNVFAAPQQDRQVRNNLEPGGAGRSGLYGDQGDPDKQWQRKTNLAGVVSQRVETAAPKFDETSGYERKNQELYGNSKYAPAAKRGGGDLMTSAADWRNPQQTYTTAKDNVAPGLGAPYEHDQQRKARKANQLQSNVLTHQDDNLREERNRQFDASGGSKISAQASNANWAAQSGFQKPINAGAVDPYRQRQNQLASTSGALEQTDYSSFAPMNKKSAVDADNQGYNRTGYMNGSPKKQANKAIESHGVNWLGGGNNAGGKVNNRPGEYEAQTKQQGFLQSSQDAHGYLPEQQRAVQEKRDHDQEYQQKNQYSIPARNGPQKTKLMNQTSNIMGHDVQKYYDKGNLANEEGKTLDFDLRGLQGSAQGSDLKRAAGVKHVISSDVNIDNFTGQCKGDGRLKVRLSAGETEAQVKANLARAGIMVKDHEENPKKNTAFSGPPKDDGKPKNSKAHELRSKQPIS